MDARARCLFLLIAIVPALGASSRTRNFIVTASTPELAHEIAQAAERYRRDLALQWLERELPPWHKPCPIVAKVSPQLPAGGRTSFMFSNRVPFGWDMEIQGTRERVLDSVLPHEITHTLFATHFGRPLPRWADEGACTTVEHDYERRKQELWLIRFLKTERGIPFNRMFAMTEYPGDILPLYSQGYSVARYLIARGGKPKFVEFVGYGMDTANWPAAVRKFYGFESLGKLQLTWVEWVKQGSPEGPIASADPMASTDPVAGSDPVTSPGVVAAAEASAVRLPPVAPRGQRPLIDSQLAMAAEGPHEQATAESGERSWYARRQQTDSGARSQGASRDGQRVPLQQASLPQRQLSR